MATETAPAPSFEITDEQRLIMDQADRFAREQRAPDSERMANEEWWPDEMFRLLGENGYLGIDVSEEYGGAGMDFFTSSLVGQVLGGWVGLDFGSRSSS